MDRSKLKFLLISNSINFNQGYLDHCESAIKNFLKPIGTILFIPFALKDVDGYAKLMTERFQRMNITLTSLHASNNKLESINNAHAFFVGGGNTFRLLNELDKQKLLDPIRQKVLTGTPYIGASAGSNLACPTIKTTNDMPIVDITSLNALNLVPFQINPHYIDTKEFPTHMVESREQRIKEFHEENDTPVVGLREGAWLRIEGNTMILEGKTGAKLFEKGNLPRDLQPQSKLDYLL
jgi:dipeptidase E